jgi:1-aminocyclopropane-1-carboxylate deaminase
MVQAGIEIERLADVNGSSLYVKRDDLIDPMVSGNKLYKLKLNLEHASASGASTILTFGGAYSNHIAATAAYSDQMGFKSVGIIRGEPTDPLNPTLTFARSKGMHLHFVSRKAYALRSNEEYITRWQDEYKNALIIPEGGANRLGIEGASAMLNAETTSFTHIVCAVGTATTVAGLAMAATPSQRIIGMVIHRHEEIINDVIPLIPEKLEALQRICWHSAHFGGYAKWTPELISFIQGFYQKNHIRLDPIYTGKAMHETIALMGSNVIPTGSKVLFMHTGGLQGIEGFEARFGIKLF